MSIFRDAVPSDTFLDRYLQYNSEIESPLAYDFTAGLWLLSAAIGRRIRVERPRAPVWLNLYVILCADAGTTRKSTSIRRCEEVFAAAGFGDDYVTITGGSTPESLSQALGQRTASHGEAAACLLVAELVTLLGRERHNMGMPGLLTDLYDCPSQREIRRAGVEAVPIRNTFVNLIAASTPSWLLRAINPEVVEGGFTSRCLFVIEEQRKRRIAWPAAEDDSAEQLGALAADLRAIREHAERHARRGITLHESARERFVAWYERRENSGDDAFTASFEAREDHHVLRLAGLLSANDGSWMISSAHLGHAIKIISQHKQRTAHLFGAGREAARLVAGIDRVRDTLLSVGAFGIAQTDLMYRTRKWIKVTELEYLILLMHELEMVQRFELRTGGRIKTIWRATEKLMARDINTLLLERLTPT